MGVLILTIIVYITHLVLIFGILKSLREYITNGSCIELAIYLSLIATVIALGGNL